MRKALTLTLSVVLLALSAGAQDKPVKPCVIVRTGKGSMKIDAGGECHGTRSCFLYIDSMNVPTSDIKDQYTAKDVQKLEKKATKVVVVPSTQTVDLQAARDSCQK
jgi:hypothetical protein